MIDWAVIAAIAALGAVTMSTPVADSARLSVKLRQRREHARTIERMLRAAGFDDRAVKAAIVNAIRESGLNPLAIGDSGHSVGLFQLSDWGAGKGMTVAARQNPVTNIQTIIDRELKSSSVFGKAFRAVASNPASSAEDVAAAFTVYVERPMDKAGEALKSRSIVRSLWGA